MNSNNKRLGSSTGNNNFKKTKTTGDSRATTSQSSASGKVKFNKETFIRSLKKLKLYVEGDRYYEQAKIKMDWQAEANALINDIRAYVEGIELSEEHKSSDTRIYFKIVTLEGTMLIVSMDSSGFMICDNKTYKQSFEQQEETILEDTNRENSIHVYETINSLLDDNSPKYRQAFADHLHRKMMSLE